MADRREERERLRRQRLAAERSAGTGERTRLILGYAVAGVLGLAVLAGLIAVIASGGGGDGGDSGECSEAHIVPEVGSFEGLEPDCRSGTAPPALQQGDLELAAKRAGCTLRLNLPDEGATHVPNSKPVAYDTDPPASGNHNENPIADGAYLTPLPPTAEGLSMRNVLHSLEHSRIAIHYSSDLAEADQLALKGLFDESPGGMLLLPNDKMPYEVAATAWRQLLGCPSYNERVLDAIRDFRDIYIGQGPEAVPISG